MSTQVPKGGRARDAAFYCLDNQATDEEAAELFGVTPGSVKCVRSQLKIRMTGLVRADHGCAVSAAKDYLQSELTLKSFASERGVNPNSIRCALNRMGHSTTKDRPNRRLMKHKGLYYFRVRTEALNVFTKLSTDITKARLMRDKLETKYKL
jgi:hypothetical protein